MQYGTMTKKMDTVFRTMNEDLMTQLLNNFRVSNLGNTSLNSCRDKLRLRLQQICPQKFTWGQFTSILDLLECLLTTQTDTLQRSIQCDNNHMEHDVQLQNKNCLIETGSLSPTSVQLWMTNFKESIVRKCNYCMERL